MKLAFSRPTASLDEQHRMFEQFRAVGYDGLQLKQGQYREFLDAPERFRDEYGAIPGVASALILFAPLNDVGIATLRSMFRFAEVVNSELIVYCQVQPREGTTDSDLRGYARTLSELGRQARQHGTRLSLHHHYDQPVMHRRDFDTFFEAVEDDAVGLTLDTAHLVKSGLHDVAGLIRDFRPVIDNFHLKDYADGEWRVLGQGDINFAPIFTAIAEIGYDGWLSADEESGSELLSGMQACRQFIDAGLASVPR